MTAPKTGLTLAASSPSLGPWLDHEALRLGRYADGLALALLGRKPAQDQVRHAALARLRHIIRERAHLGGQHQAQVVFVDGVRRAADSSGDTTVEKLSSRELNLRQRRVGIGVDGDIVGHGLEDHADIIDQQSSLSELSHPMAGFGIIGLILQFLFSFWFRLLMVVLLLHF